MRLLTAFAVILGVLLLSAATSAQVINGCVKDKNGALRIVADSADCTSRETPISWNQVGPQGEPGADGVDGSDAEVLYVFDGDGVALGRYGGGGPGGVQVFDETNEVMLSVDADGSLSVTSATIYFDSADCTGIPYFEAGQRLVARFLYANWQRFFAIDTTVSPVILPTAWVLDATSCHAVSGQRTGQPGWEMFLGLSFPLPAPLYVGLAP